MKMRLIFLMFLLGLLTQNAFARDDHDLDLLIQNDRQERVERINEMTLKLNESLFALKSLKLELENALIKEKESHTIKLVIKNAAEATAAIGVISIVIYQAKGKSPNKITLSGGYTVAGLAALIAYMENRSIMFTKAEIDKLMLSVKDLEKKAETIKRNLIREVRLLCLEDGGSSETCDEINLRLR